VGEVLESTSSLARRAGRRAATPGTSVCERRQAMSYSISTVLTRNLHDVFGENDPARRRAAIDEIITEDCVFYEPRGVYRGRDEIDRAAGAIKANHPGFRYQPMTGPEEFGNGGRVQWVSGRPGEAPGYAGTDFIIAREGQIAAVQGKHGLESWSMWLSAVCFLVSTVLPSASRGESVPVVVITRQGSTIAFSVKASVAIEGTFDKWDATMTFKSTDATTGVLRVKIQAASVDTGSGIKNNTLKGKDFFDVQNNPLITFVSRKVAQTGSDTFEIEGDFTIRGVTKPETLLLRVSGKGTGSGEITGTMAFDRKDYGMNSGIPFIRIADRVEVKIALKGKRVGGPPLVFQNK
jgi:polyisoprenoid-binding protein YceI